MGTLLGLGPKRDLVADYHSYICYGYSSSFAAKMVPSVAFQPLFGDCVPFGIDDVFWCKSVFEWVAYVWISCSAFKPLPIGVLLK